jgi:hypothetical protein
MLGGLAGCQAGRAKTHKLSPYVLGARGVCIADREDGEGLAPALKTIGLYARWRTEHPGRKEVQWKSVCNKAALPLLQFDPLTHAKGDLINNIVYIVGAIVIIVAILSFLGLR